MQQKPGDELRVVRWADFRRRVQYAPRTVYYHRKRGWEYIPIHPFGDEPQLLHSLSLRPTDCRNVDTWWGLDGDATLLESMIAKLSDRPPGLYVKATPHEERWVYVLAVFDAPYITRSALEDAMVRFADAGFPSESRFRLKWGDPWLVLDGGPATA